MAASGCSNSPYRSGETLSNTRYSTISEDPKSLDPSFAYDMLSLEIAGALYESPLQYSYLKRPYQLEPALAAEMPRRETYVYEAQETLQDAEGTPLTGPDGRPMTAAIRRDAFRYRITLRPGLRFQDDPCFAATAGQGRALTIDDFIYAIQRLADPSVTCPVRAILGEKIVGLNDFYYQNRDLIRKQRERGEPPHADYSLPVAGIRRIGNLSCDILLTEKYPQFLYWLAMPFTAPIPREAVEYYDSTRFPGRPDFRHHPVGTGAYRLTEYRRRHRLVLERNPNARAEPYPSDGEPDDRAAGLLHDAGQPLPLVDRWVFTTVKESIPRWNLFKQGYLDTSGVPRDAFDRVITPEGGLSPEMQRRGIRLFRSRELSTYYFAFNMDDPVVGRNRRLRQAINAAIHTREFLEIFQNGLGVVAHHPLPPGLSGRDPDTPNPYREYNLALARDLLAQAGYPNGLDPRTREPLAIRYDTSATSAQGRQETNWVIKQFAALGIRIEPSVNDWNTHQQKADDGNFQFIRYGWVADYPDPENFLFLLYSSNRRPGVNYANYSNPEYDRLFEEMKGMSQEGDEGKSRQAIIGQMLRILAEDCPWVPHYHPETYSLAHAWTANIKLHGPAMNLLKYQRIDPGLRAQCRDEWNPPRTLAVGIALALAMAAAIPALRIVRRTDRPC